jgi:hypothetical protein
MLVWKLVCYIRQRTETAGVQEQIAEESIWTKQGKINFFFGVIAPSRPELPHSRVS